MRKKNIETEKRAALEGKGSNTTIVEAPRATTEGLITAEGTLGKGYLQLLSPRAPSFERLALATVRQSRGPVGMQESIARGLLTELMGGKELMARVAAINPKASSVVARLAGATHWSAEWEMAEEWFAYVSRQRADHWHEAMVALEEFKKTLEFLAAVDKTLVVDLPMLKAFFEVREQIATRSAETRKANAAAKREEEQKPSQ